jgi:hypothetical protein
MLSAAKDALFGERRSTSTAAAGKPLPLESRQDPEEDAFRRTAAMRLFRPTAGTLRRHPGVSIYCSRNAVRAG